MKALWRAPLIFLITEFCILLRVLGVPAPKVLRWWSRSCLRVHGIRVIVHGEPDKRAQHMICNHVSHIDGPAIFTVMPDVHVVGMKQINNYLSIGRLLGRCGMIWVDRESPDSRAEVRRKLAEAWKRGEVTGICPEGTVSYTGLSFKPGSFEEAMKAGVWIQGITIRYPKELVNHMNGKFMQDSLWDSFNQSFDIELIFHPAEPAIAENAKELADHWNRVIMVAL